LQAAAEPVTPKTHLLNGRLAQTALNQQTAAMTTSEYHSAQHSMHEQTHTAADGWHSLICNQK
jgi:hypothetical protein